MRGDAADAPGPASPGDEAEVRLGDGARWWGGGTTYLDHAGACPAAPQLLEAAFRTLQRGGPRGNPHSGFGGEAVHRARALTLALLNAPPGEYRCVFTSGATGALKLVAEAFPWSAGSTFAHTLQNHSSVLGMRQTAAQRGARCTALEVAGPPDGPFAFRSLGDGAAGWRDREPKAAPAESLFAYPAECNFSGAKLGPELARQVKRGQGVPAGTRWWTLVDAAKACGTDPPDLSAHAADFTVLSYYKIFGYPSGLGALVVHRRALDLLHKPYFGGGTVDVALPDSGFYRRRNSAEGFEDGTLAFLEIEALPLGFRLVERLTFPAILRHCQHLTRYACHEMHGLKHFNGDRLCRIYGNHLVDGKVFESDRRQGPVVAFNLRHADGTWVGYKKVERLAETYGIQLRTGCMCNPGACMKYVGLTGERMLQNFHAGHVCGDGVDVLEGRPTGAIRVSFGYYNAERDVQRLVGFLRDHFLQTAPQAELSADFSDGEGADRRPYLKALYVYPIKSCGAAEARAWPLRGGAFLHDRRWAVVDSSGKLMTQKRYPAMANVVPTVDLAAGTVRLACRGRAGGVTFRIGAAEEGGDGGDGDGDGSAEMDVRVCGRTEGSRRARYAGADAWLGEVLGVRCYLVEACPGGGGAPANGPESVRGRYTNQAQVLVFSEATVAGLNAFIRERSGAPSEIEPAQFRPNLVVGGCPPHAEECWEAFTVGGVAFRDAGRCMRCSMVNVSQRNGVSERGLLKAVSEYRKGRGTFLGNLFNAAGPGEAGEAGEMGQEEEEEVQLVVGAEIEVVAKADPE